MRHLSQRVWLSSSAAALTVALAAQNPPARSVQMPERVVEMQHHFLDVTAIHEAITRGDLAATLQAAARLSVMASPAGVPGSSEPFVERIRLAGRRLVQTPTLQSAAVEATQMLRQCGACHQSMSVFPATSTRISRDVGGIVGHMLEHRLALDDLLVGLVIPSDRRWREGVARLDRAALHPANWPADRDLTPEVRRAEQVVHDIARDASRATTPLEKGDVYARLLLTCASCHGLHARIWGPRAE